MKISNMGVEIEKNMNYNACDNDVRTQKMNLKVKPIFFLILSIRTRKVLKQRSFSGII